MIVICLLFFSGLFLSAFFSGSETGFYRATRVRLVMDAMSGGWVSTNLLRLANHPTVFVATTLIGNNVANYLTSLAVVLLSRELPGRTSVLELVLPVLASPIVFVYGELLPKNLFYHAPNLLLRRAAPLFLLFTILFAPISAVLVMLGRFLQTLLGQPPLRLRFTLARKELRELIHEGQAAGLLQPYQRQLAENLMQVAARPVRTFCRPVARIPTAELGQDCKEILRVARRSGAAAVLVKQDSGRRLRGYVRVIDLRLTDTDQLTDCWPLQRIPQNETQLGALVKMEMGNVDLAEVIDERGHTVGVVFAKDLIEPLFQS